MVLFSAMNSKIIQKTAFLFETFNCPTALIGSTAIYLHYENQKEKLKKITNGHYIDTQEGVDFIGYSEDFISLRNDFPLYPVDRFNKLYAFYFENIDFFMLPHKFHKLKINTDDRNIYIISKLR